MPSGTLQLQVGAVGAVAVAARALLADGGVDVRVEVEVEQGVHVRVDDQHDAAAAAAVAAVRAAERLELLAVDRGAAVTAVAGPRVEHDAVDEARHRDHTSECHVMAGNGSRSRRGVTVAKPRPWGVGSAGTMLTVLRPRLVPNSTAPASRGEQGVVAAAADVHARVELGAALADEDLAGLDDLAAEPLDAEALGVGVATVA